MSDEELSPTVSLLAVGGKLAILNDILLPVVITMCAVLWLAWSLRSSNAFNPMQQQTSIATMAYTETESDSTAERLTGALLNALLFIVAVALMTFAMVACFKYRCFKCVYCFIGLSVLSALGSVSQLVLVNLLDAYRIPTDSISFYYIIWNFAAVGMVAIFTPAPAWIKHGYLIAMSVLIAHIFSGLPQWTGWSVLGALVIYDLLAVLCPHGPLAMLIDATQEQNAEIPGLLYEITDEPTETSTSAQGDPEVDDEERADEERASLLVEEESNADQQAGSASEQGMGAGRGEEVIEMHALRQMEPQTSAPEHPDSMMQHEEGDVEEAGSGLKLGLGDFIFYSVLVAGASKDTTATTAACFISIIFGMASTILLLGVVQKALPALPISLTIGILVYFIFSGFAAMDAQQLGSVGVHI